MRRSITMDDDKIINQANETDNMNNLSEEDFLSDAEFFDSVETWGNMIIASK